MHTVDVERLTEALEVEGKARQELVQAGQELRAKYKAGGSPSGEEVKQLRHAVKTWMKAAKVVANVIGEPID